MLAAIFHFSLPGPVAADECTTAVISGTATIDGRPLLWKNRDTDEQNNKLIFLTEGPFLAVGLADVTSLSSVWMGVNEKGFAIENSDSEDLGSSGAENGTFMRYALLHCASVADFENLLVETNITSRKTRANYGVIDALGNAAIFEVGSDSFYKFDANDPAAAPHGFLVRTNFAFTGDGSGAGYIRYDRAMTLLTPAAMTRSLSHKFMLKTLARDLNNEVIDPYPLPYEGSQDGLPEGYIRTNNSINRYRTRSCGVFHGVLPGEDPLLTTMWVILGEPVCSIAVPVWVMAGSVPQELNGSNTAPFCDAAIVKKSFCYPLTVYPEYINTYRLDNGLGGGTFSFTIPTEDWTLKIAQDVMTEWRGSLPLARTVAQVQNQITRQAYWCLLSSSAAKDELASPRNLICWTFRQKEFGFSGSSDSHYLHLLRWRSPVQGEAASYRVYDVSSGQKIFLAEIPGNKFSYFRLVSEQNKKYIYAVLAVDYSGTEGSPACVTSQPFNSIRNMMPDKSRLPAFRLASPGQIDFEIETKRLFQMLR